VSLVTSEILKMRVLPSNSRDEFHIQSSKVIVHCPRRIRKTVVRRFIEDGMPPGVDHKMRAFLTVRLQEGFLGLFTSILQVLCWACFVSLQFVNLPCMIGPHSIVGDYSRSTSGTNSTSRYQMKKTCLQKEIAFS